MKKQHILSALVCLLANVCLAQKKYEMVIEKTDGTNIVVNTEDIIRIYFQERTGSGGQQSYQSCPDDHHPHMIDLGLPSGTKWACCNLGATTPEAYGGYYAWGETEEKMYYSKDNYKFNYQSLGGDIAGTNYDVALVVWGRTWQMPSLEQIKELLDNCYYQWTSVNGINGGKFISKNNGASIFLPAAGRYDADEHDFYGRGSLGYYWTSTQSAKDDDDACDLDFEDGEAYWGDDDRSRGQTVRPVSR